MERRKEEEEPKEVKDTHVKKRMKATQSRVARLKLIAE
jgi:hypothetical protein